MTINKIIENFTHINKDVPLINLNGTSLYIDDILLIVLAIILLNENSTDFTIPLICLLLIFN